MVLDKKQYKQHLKSIYVPTIELIIDSIVDGLSATPIVQGSPEKTKIFIELLTTEKILEALENSSIDGDISKANVEYFNEIQKY